MRELWPTWLCRTSTESHRKQMDLGGPNLGYLCHKRAMRFAPMRAKTSEADVVALETWMKQMKDLSDKGKAPYYRVNSQNCATFCIAGLLRANAIQRGSQPTGGSSLQTRRASISNRAQRKASTPARCIL
jgi:hypothetical protein